jgi:hypothetical protein
MPAARSSTSTAMASRRSRSVSRRAVERSASRRAKAVQVLRVAEDGSEVEDVTRYLAPHDVNATTRQVAVSASTATEDLQRAGGRRRCEPDRERRLRLQPPARVVLRRGRARPAGRGGRLLSDEPLTRGGWLPMRRWGEWCGTLRISQKNVINQG